MVEKNTLAKIFKAVCKNSINSIGINFRQFQETLFRIGVKSKELLNGIIERRQEKEKKMAEFLSKKSSEGNHYDVDSEISRVSPSRII